MINHLFIPALTNLRSVLMKPGTIDEEIDGLVMEILWDGGFAIKGADKS